MKRTRNVSSPGLIWIPVFTVMMAVLLGLSGYYGLLIISGTLSEIFDPAGGSGNLKQFMEQVDVLKNRFFWVGLPMLSALFFSWGLLLWLILRPTREKGSIPERSAGAVLKNDIKKFEAPLEKIVYRVDKNKEKRLYAHLLSVFQREGRLVDFLNEDLEGYEDAQVGAAVRNIHADCRKALDRLVRLKAVAEKDEGDEITVKEGFDPAAIRLVGNVQGEPPFKGIIRHRGWRIESLNIPDLSGDDFAGILEPAEIEIL